MKKILNIIIIIVSIYSCKKRQSEFKIHGKIEGVENSKDTLWEYKYESGWIIIDTTRILNNEFLFHGTVALPKPYYLAIDGISDDVLIFIENCNMYININKDNFKQLKINGSELNDQYAAYLKFREANFDNKIDSLRKLKDISIANGNTVLVESISKKIDQVEFELKENAISFVKENNSSIVSPVIVGTGPERYMLNHDDLMEILNSFDISIKGTDQVKELQIIYDGLINKSNGSPIHHLVINDTIGNPVSTHMFEGRVWLLDFWSSKCGPCRKENPVMERVYQKYKPFGFEIYGVSFDSKSKEWIKAIKQDKISWIQVCELKGWANAAKIIYGIEYLPQNLLVNRDGIIIASGLNGETLDSKLAEIYNRLYYD